MRDFENAFSVREVGAADEASNANGSAAGFAEVNAGVARVGYDVAADGVDSIAEEYVRFCHDLVGDDGDSVEGSCEADELVHVFVQFLLAEGKSFSADIFTAEVAGKGVDDNQADVVLFYHFVGVFKEEDLMVAGVSVGDYDVFSYFWRV